MAGTGEAWRGTARQAGPGAEGLGRARQGLDGQGADRHGKAGPARLGKAWRGRAWRGRDRKGLERHGRRGKERPGTARHGMDRQGMAGQAGQGKSGNFLKQNMNVTYTTVDWELIPLLLQDGWELEVFNEKVQQGILYKIGEHALDSEGLPDIGKPEKKHPSPSQPPMRHN
jgi:hypothetical protein